VATTKRVGVWLFPAAPAARLVDAVVRAERLGLDEVWLADEGVAREPMAVLAAAARETTRIGLAVGITSPVLRHPGALAATAATVDELSGGRFTLGLGIGGDKSLAPFGLVADGPVARMTDAIATARAVLDGRADDDAGYRPPDHAAPPRTVPIWVGARGPRLLELAAREADGIFVSGCSPAQHDRVAAVVAPARSTGREVGLALYQSAGSGPPAPSVCRWDEVAGVLGREAERLNRASSAPTSIGINLVELLDPSADPVGAVERAASALGRG
jgi:5,10-methylenetetrahydromethanopterin reductase